MLIAFVSGKIRIEQYYESWIVWKAEAFLDLSPISVLTGVYTVLEDMPPLRDYQPMSFGGKI
jgi:hypothetical protein